MRRRLTLLLLLSCSTTLSSTSAFGLDSPPPLKLVKSIPLPTITGRMDHFSIDLQHKVAFVAALGSNSVVAVDLDKGTTIGQITGLTEPQGVLFVPQNGHLYIANGGDGSLRIYDATTLRPLKNIPLGDDADNIRYDPSSKTIWVGYGSGALAALDLDGNKLSEVPVGEHPEAFQLEVNGSKLFVNVPRRKELVIVDRNKRSILGTYPTGTATGNFPMAFDQQRSRLFVACRTPAKLVVLNASTGATITQLDTVNDADDLFYDSTNHRIYVIGGGGAIVVYQQNTPDSYSETTRVPTISGARTGLFIPTLKQLLVAIPKRGQQDAAIQVYDVR